MILVHEHPFLSMVHAACRFLGWDPLPYVADTCAIGQASEALPGEGIGGKVMSYVCQG